MKIRNFVGALLTGAAMILCTGAGAQPVYKVGSTPTGNPFTFVDVKTNKVDGMMVDLMNELGREAGFKPDIEAIPFGVLIPSLTSGKINIISAAMMITPARAQVVDFTEPLFPYAETMVVLKTDNTPYRSAKELANQVVGVQAGTAYLAYLQKLGGFAEIKTYDAIADIMRDVALGRIKAGFVDEPILRYRLSQEKESAVRLVSTYEPQVVGQVGLAVKKGDTALLNQLNTAIAKVKADGRIAKLQEKWGLR
jgi:polar amino acid transport system substrate-binding protein